MVATIAIENNVDLSDEWTRGTLRYPDLKEKLELGIEVFVDLVGFELDYVVGSWGTVKKKLSEGKYKKPLKGSIKNGTYVLGLTVALKLHSVRLKNAVINSFYVNPFPTKFTYIIHKDKDELNVALGNLYFATLKYKQSERPAKEVHSAAEIVDMTNEHTKGTLRYPELDEQLKNGDEVFVDVSGYNNYVISNYGVVKRKRPNGKFRKPLKGSVNLSGYHVTSLTTSSKLKSIGTHILVMNSFYINPDKDKFCTVDHSDRNRSNVNLDNLCFASRKFQRFNQTRSEHSWQSYKKKHMRPIRMLNVEGTFIREFEGREAAAEWLRLHGGYPNAYKRNLTVLKTRKNIHYGYLWEYPEVTDLENEQWKDVPLNVYMSKQGPFKVSNMGRLKNRFGKLIHGTENVYISISNYGLHRIVALTWIYNDDPDNKVYVNHIDGNKLNNQVSNLEWVSQSENIQHAYNTGLFHSLDKYVTINVNTGDIVAYKTVKKCEKDIGVNRRTIQRYIASKKIYKCRRGIEYLFEIISN